MNCASCGNDAPVRDAEFRLLVGALVVDFNHVKKDRLCPQCIHTTFWTYTLTTLVLGWWSLSSFLLTPVVLFTNVVCYWIIWKIAPFAVDPVPLRLTPELVAVLKPCRDEIFRRVLSGESMEHVATDIGNRVGASATEVKAFYDRSYYSDLGEDEPPGQPPIQTGIQSDARQIRVR